MSDIEVEADGHIREALKSAEAELAELNRRRSVLTQFIASSYRLLGESPKIYPNLRGRPQGGVWIHIDALMRERQAPMSVKEITQSLTSRGLIQGRWAREVVRNALNRGPQYQRVSPGVYVLIEDAHEG